MLDVHFKNSEETWDLIAESFDNTRRTPWIQTVEFINNLNSSDIVADIGCGNGRHLGLIVEKCKIAIGIDISKNLLKIIENKIDRKKQKTILIHGNNVFLPLKDNFLDAAIYIAALHNIKGRKNRIDSLKELYRILKKDGIAMISVWSREQERFKDILNNTDKNDFKKGDISLYWRQNNLNVPRFYHLYTKDEFIEDIKKSKLKIKQIIEAKIQSEKCVDNYFAIVRK